MWVYNPSSKKFILIVLYLWNNDLMVVANEYSGLFMEKFMNLTLEGHNMNNIFLSLKK